LLRPTLSPGLFYQMVGRGFRLHPAKQNCLVLDFGGNVMRHGPVDQIRIQYSHQCGGKTTDTPAKECPNCHSVVATGYAICPDCGYVFAQKEREPKHDANASSEGILSGQVTETDYQVRDVFYSVHYKQGADENTPKSMRVDYRIGFHRYKSEWICFEHQGFPRRKAEQWWRARSHDPIPETAQQAVDMANAGGLAMTMSITVRTMAGEKFDRVVDYELGEKPDVVQIEMHSHIGNEEIPF
jgi:DNA repair protein RadD